ncbi:MAG TPA: hypothetical protein PLN04_04360, partial [Moraxellaceae bacterium]|nr:hypothetical protein [Moraxellaceae bacterium]
MFRRSLLALACTAVTALATTVISTSAIANTDGLEELRAELARQNTLITNQQKQLEALAGTVESTPAVQGSNATTIGFYGEMHFNNRDDNDP